MEENIAWNVFTMTGKVEDYIRFKSLKKTQDENTENKSTVNDNKKDNADARLQPGV